MAKVTIEVGKDEDDFTVMRDGEAFSLRPGECIVLMGEDGLVLDDDEGCDCGDEPVILHILYPVDIADGEDDEPVGVPGAPAGASAEPIKVPDPANDEEAEPYMFDNMKDRFGDDRLAA